MANVQAENSATSDAPAHSSRVVVKFEPELRLSNSKNAEAEYAEAHAREWQDLYRQFPGIKLQPYFAPLDAAVVERLERRSIAAGMPLQLISYFAIVFPPDTDPASVVKAVATLPQAEFAYLEGRPMLPMSPPVNAADDPLSASQGYLNAAPIGINARYAWDHKADGTGIGLVDLEQGWMLNHEDLPPNIIVIGSGQQLPDWLWHGTAVLGIVAAVDNDKGVVGIAPRAKVSVVSQYFGYWNTAAAIVMAIEQMTTGDVLLIETTAPMNPDLGWVPAEVQPLVFDLIKFATSIGITVVAPAGNNWVDSNDNFMPVPTSTTVGKGSNLNTFTDGNGKHVLDRNKPQEFKDSGAIMVGAGSSAVPHQRRDSSNFGSRVDCYAWGENITTCDLPPNKYRSEFGGASGATAIVAGAAVLLQCWAVKQLGHVLDTVTLRNLLSSPYLNTKSATPYTDLIGVMPDLKTIIQALNVHPRLPEEVIKVFGGVAQDGPGIIIVNGHLIRVPPRGPEMDILLALAIKHLADEISPVLRGDIIRATLDVIRKVAEKDRMQ